MKIKTNVKAGRLSMNHNQRAAKANVPIKRQSQVGGGMGSN